ncbi:MAG: hypothetical protein J5J06_09370 [Phycisphaerae bacterium]|nr:hypothetical protein [Phycisphaerae bacterium]
MRALWHPGRLPFRPSGIFAALAALSCGLGFGGCASTPKQPPPPAYSWGNCAYRLVADNLKPKVQAELAKPMRKRAKDAGVTLLDYASACLASGRYEEAQRYFYEAILLTNDLALDKAGGEASLTFAESLKTWQGEAYERATIELLHGIALMRLGDFDNARVAFDRAISTDRFSKGAVTGYEGTSTKNGLAFQPNERYSQQGGSVYQRDFLAAYLLRTLCYIQDGRLSRARRSYDEFRRVYAELREAAEAAPVTAGTRTWTGSEGRYSYPNVFLSPLYPSDPGKAFALSFDDLRSANLLVVSANGCRPRKVKTGPMGYNKAHFVHDAYLRPSEPVHKVDMFVDDRYVGALTSALNLFGQAAGRGPSAKDIAQEKKGGVETFGEILQQHGSYGIQYIGVLIQAVNQEEADVRQWGLLPNSIHLWIGHVPSGTHNLELVASGRNIPVREQGWPAYFPGAIQGDERAYLSDWSGWEYAPGGSPLAPRHTLSEDVVVPDVGLNTVFLAENFNGDVSSVADSETRSYELLPRRVPEK